MQVWQMPIRHPLSGDRPAASAWASSGRPSPTMSMPLSANVIRPPDVCSTGSNVGVTKLSARAFGQSSRTASTNAVGRKRTPRPVPALRPPGARAEATVQVARTGAGVAVQHAHPVIAASSSR
ncbi:hypothetical protein I553_8420 [Mycobacterium xenopi 4042]|uniref:Uncharacterized protein n=1 Tax=Mycobacterium xenopi 4042 TaxID=1299334 RepID=X8EVQ4_MYCXE|nr:hypothetical protein I553_8420 [Mycobacterium xenopi 4042]